ncbi:glycosyltransferase family 2 protein [Kineococcus glutinatus]|uniref:4,4'-diaponeurosporenoate glycosyltransferase n=1 Tax=Kineococcus glutinatus TaxID=1070872 RepID=A0ABP9HLW1_9ACTN
MSTTAAGAAPRTDAGLAGLSVVIPAHDEERQLRRCLPVLLDGLGPAEVVVVANGCSDSTAEVARSFPGVRVVELAEASKVAALNAGDAAVGAFPRIYLDADIRMSGRTARELAASLRDGSAAVASPRVRFDVSASSRPVRAFYRVYEELPYVREGLVGLGVYGVSAQGRARFGAFPDVTNDDLFVQRSFAPDERRRSRGEFTVSAPHDVRNLLRVRRRTAAGNAELSRRAHPPGGAPARGEGWGRSTGTTTTALFALARRRPRLLPAVATYAAVTAASRVLARLDAGGWQRDTSTR